MLGQPFTLRLLNERRLLQAEADEEITYQEGHGQISYAAQGLQYSGGSGGCSKEDATVAMFSLVLVMGSGSYPTLAFLRPNVSGTWRSRGVYPGGSVLTSLSYGTGSVSSHHSLAPKPVR